MGINSSEIIEYAKQTIDKIHNEYRGAAPGEFDIDIATKMIDSINILMSTAVKLEAINALDKLQAAGCDEDTANAIVNALHDVIRP